MFRYFPDNYVWSLSVAIALGHGGQIGEVERMCAPLKEIAGNGDDEGTQAFFQSWCDYSDYLVGLAMDDLACGRSFAAADRLLRTSVYYLVAERMQSRHFAPRAEAYRKALESFRLGIEHSGAPVEFVEIPYGDSFISGIFHRAGDGSAPGPVVLACNGLDSFKEWGHGVGLGHELARRGISMLFVDQPGTGDALRLRNLHGVHDSERWASAAVDYLITRPDVDPARIGMTGWSLGGYFVPRATAFEKRIAACAAWGANYNWGELQKRRLAREGDRPVPHYWEHVQWVFGKNSLEEFMEWAPSMTLEGVNEQITVPYLLVHGENDSQIPFEYAIAQHETATGSPDHEFKVFTAAEGGAMHAAADNSRPTLNHICDWFAAKLR